MIVKNVMIACDSSIMSGLDCIPMAVLKSCQSELLLLLASFLLLCLTEPCFQDFWMVFFVVSLFQNARQGPMAKSCRPLSPLLLLERYLRNL